MQTLELECPSCSELLELDVGFAGGVCRCSNCGTLMTVPDEAGAGPESLSRPDRPEDPSAASAAGDSLGLSSAIMDRPESPAPVEQSAPRSSAGRSRAGSSRSRGKTKGRTKGKAASKRSSTRGKKSAGTRRARAERVEAGDYRTASGKVIHLDQPTEVPTAVKRRHGVRIATGVIFMGIVLVIAVVAIAVVVIVAKPPTAEELEQQEAERRAIEDANKPPFEYDVTANPVTIPFVNVLGLPLTERTAVVVEGSTDSNRWLEPLSQVLAKSLAGKTGKGSVAIYGATPNGVQTLGQGMTPGPSVNVGATAAFFNTLNTNGDPAMAAGISYALRGNPTSIVLIVADADDDALAAWDTALKGKDDLLVHVVLIDGYSRALGQWSRDRSDGQFVELIRDDLTDWLEDATPEAEPEAQAE